MNVEPAVAEIARRQHGLITHDQAISVGVTPSAIRHRVAKGTWVRARRSVYAVAAVAPSPEQAALAVCLATGEGRCWVSHRSAAAVWGLQVPSSPVIEVVTPSAIRIDQKGVRQHRSNELYLADLTWHRNLPVTSVARTLVDCVPFVRSRRLVWAVDDAERRGLLPADDLAACAGRLDHRGRRLVTPLRPVLDDRARGRVPGGSRRELDLIEVLRTAGVPLPVQQFKVLVGGRQRVLDYAYVEELIDIEFDGFAEHGLIRSTFDDDRLRGNDLVVAGWLTLHFTSNSSPDHIIARTKEALRLRGRRLA